MVFINASLTSQSQLASLLKSANSSCSRSTATAGTASASQASSGTDISSQASALFKLYDAASSFVKSQSMTNFSGYVQGNVTPSAYIDVGEYNDYVFDKAASAMVDEANNLGISLDKNDVISQLRQENSDISNIKSDQAKTNAALGASSVYLNLSASDRSALTDIYIKAKEGGLDTDQVEVLAAKKAFTSSLGSDQSGAVFMPADWDWSETDPDKIAAAKASIGQAAEIVDKADEVKSKLISDLGLGKDFISHILDAETGGGITSSSTLEFLSKLADIYGGESTSD